MSRKKRKIVGEGFLKRCPFCNSELCVLGPVFVDGNKFEDEIYEYFPYLCPNCLKIFATKFTLRYVSEIGKHVVKDITFMVEIGELKLKIPYTHIK